jgi:hypothetical protein
MKIPVVIVSIFLTGILGLEAWTLNMVVDLKADVAAIKVELRNRNLNQTQNHEPESNSLANPGGVALAWHH